MPLLLSPFKNILFFIDKNITDLVDKELENMKIDIKYKDVLDCIRNYYINMKICLDNFKNLEQIEIGKQRISYNGTLHISGEHQELLLDSILKENSFMRDIIPVMIIKYVEISPNFLFRTN